MHTIFFFFFGEGEICQASSVVQLNSVSQEENKKQRNTCIIRGIHQVVVTYANCHVIVH